MTPTSISFGFYHPTMQQFVVVEQIPITSMKEVAEHILYFHNKYGLDTDEWVPHYWDIAIHIPSKK